jgi:hypothetical protein
MAGGGCPVANKDGGVIGALTNTLPNANIDFTNVTPSAAEWYNGGANRWSIYLEQTYDITPSMKAHPQMAVYQNKLFMARNICEGLASATICTTLSANCNCPAANKRPQIWKCTPATTGGATTCESGDWTLVANNGSGLSNMGDVNNKEISMVVTNGSYLYVGFDSANGIQIWRTNNTNPTLAGDFTQEGASGLGFPVANTSIFDAKSFNFSGIDYLYLTAGKAGGAVRVYRHN